MKIINLGILLTLIGCASAATKRYNEAYKNLSDAALRMTFVSSCPAPKDSAGCLELYQGVAKVDEPYLARLKLRYKYADVELVSTWCKGYPAECAVPSTIESKFALSHNETVRQAFLKNTRELNEQYTAEYRQERAAWAAAGQAFSDSMNQNRSVSCNTMVNGNYATTNCN